MTREAKLESVQKIVKERNNYLTEYPRATVAVALKKVHTKIKKLKVEKWLNATATQRVIAIEKDQSALEQAALLDGCYVIKSDMPMEEVCVGSTRIGNIPTPNEIGRKLLKKAEIILPSSLPTRAADVHTKKKLSSERMF